MANTISTRIAIEGGDDLRKKLEELGAAGEKSFKQIQDAADKAQVDPARFAQTKQAIDGLVGTGSQLANQFLQLAQAATTFGSQGEKATASVTTGLQATGAAAGQAGGAIAQAGQQAAGAGQAAGDSLLSTANKWRLAAAGIVVAISAIVRTLVTGAGETAKELNDQADALDTTVPKWLELRQAIEAADGSADDFVKSSKGLIDFFKKAQREIGGVSKIFTVPGGVDEGGIKVAVTSMGQLTRETQAANAAFHGLGVSAKEAFESNFIRQISGWGPVLVENTAKARNFVRQLSGWGDVVSDAGAKNQMFIRQLSGWGGETSQVTEKTSSATKELLKLGVSMKTIQGGDTVALLREVATIISKIPDDALRAAVGFRFFGDKWKDAVKILATGKQEVEDLSDTLDKERKASRVMSEAEQKAAKEAADAWEGLGKALKATKDLIGSVFAGPSGARAKWLADLVDDSRILLRQWLALDEAGRADFLAGVGEGAAATAFKILIALGQQLSGLWNNVLVPAGGKLIGIFDGIAGIFEGVTGSQVAAFFIAATAGVIGFAIALKGIGLLLTPVTALISLFAGFGPLLIPLIALMIIFWDQLKEGATTALALIPNSLHGMQQAFQELFKGNFAGFWELFSASAVVAFQTIKQAVLQSEGVVGDFARAISGEGVVIRPWVQEFVDGVRKIASDLPEAIGVVLTSLVGLGKAMTFVADSINLLFGTKLTGTDIGLVVIIGTLTGAFLGLAAIINTVIGVFSVLGLAASALALILGVPFGFALILVGLFIAALALLITKWPEISAAATAAWEVITAAAGAAKQFIIDFVTTPVGNAWQWLVDKWNEAMASIADSWARLKSLLGFGGGVSKLAADAGLGDIGRNAAGGLLGGRGTGTSDSNLAWVSRGEHIMPARAVSQPGVLAFLEALRRSGGNLRDILDGMGRFAMGGLVVPKLSLPAFAGDGSMSHVTIQFPGLPEITGLRASSTVVDELRQAAAMAQVRSGGRKPSRYS